MSKFEVIRGVEGCCLALDDTRIAGPKPWGGGTVIHAWEPDKEYKAVDTQSRWSHLFGTPERAARTLFEIKCGEKSCNGCPIAEPCAECDVTHDDGESLRAALLDWLKGGA